TIGELATLIKTQFNVDMMDRKGMYEVVRYYFKEINKPDYEVAYYDKDKEDMTHDILIDGTTGDKLYEVVSDLYGYKVEDVELFDKAYLKYLETQKAQ